MGHVQSGIESRPQHKEIFEDGVYRVLRGHSIQRKMCVKEGSEIKIGWI